VIGDNRKREIEGFGIWNATPLIFLAMQAETIPSERSSSVTTGQIISRIQLKWQESLMFTAMHASWVLLLH